MPFSTPMILLLSLMLLTNLVGIEANGLVIEVAFLILLVLLSSEVARVLIILLKPRTANWGVSLGQSACFGSLVIPGDTARVGFTLGGCTVSLFDGVVQRLDNISVKASIAAFNLLPVLRNGFAAAGFFNASINSSKAVDALLADAVVGMLYFSGENTTLSETLVPLVFGIKKSQCR
jgi:hypothetical protein